MRPLNLNRCCKKIVVRLSVEFNARESKRTLAVRELSRNRFGDATADPGRVFRWKQNPLKSNISLRLGTDTARITERYPRGRAVRRHRSGALCTYFGSRNMGNKVECSFMIGGLLRLQNFNAMSLSCSHGP